MIDLIPYRYGVMNLYVDVDNCNCKPIFVICIKSNIDYVQCIFRMYTSFHIETPVLIKSTLRCKLLFLLLIIFSSKINGQPGAYYNTILSSSMTFVSDLQFRIRIPYTRVSYDNFDETNIANFTSVNNGNGTRSVFCVYSGYEYIYSGVFTWGIMSREHTWAHSWSPTFPSENTNQYSDQHNLFPTHQNNANGRRSNHPFGNVVNITYQFLEGKLGRNSNNEIVYEPRAEQKGDAVRALMYMCIRYDQINGYSWDLEWLNNTKLPLLNEASQDTNIILNWHKEDPPDKWEIDRNNYIQSIQQNRNPFIDHPEYVSYINFSNLTKLIPTFSAEPANYVTNFGSGVSGNNILLSWDDAGGTQLPSGYLVVAYKKNNYFLPIDGSEYTDDMNLSDGSAIVNIPYSNVDLFAFNDLTAGAYYFTIFSYNGSGNQTNYKIDGAFPQSNLTIAPNLAAEPTNHVTSFISNNITSSSIGLNWEDAIPGTQVPSGYLLVGNTNNVFNNPSDGLVYPNDSNLADGAAYINVNYHSSDIYTFGGLMSNTNYYFKIYSYNNIGGQINYKTNGTVPSINGYTSALVTYNSTLLDEFNRSDNNVLGNSLPPQNLPWQELETSVPSSINIHTNKMKLSGSVTGREFASLNAGSLYGYPSKFGSSISELVWAINMKQSRSDPSGFDNNNYGIAFLLGKTTSDITTGNGYAVLLGQSGSNDAVRLAKFTGGVDANSKFTNIISSGDYSNQYLSIKVVYQPSGNLWTLFVDSSSLQFPQSDPRNTLIQVGTATDSSYVSTSLSYLGSFWNHAASVNDFAIFDDVYFPNPAQTTINLTLAMEGYLENNFMSKKDTITLFLKNSTAPYLTVDSAISVIDTLTFTGSFKVSNIVSGNYYLVIRHRNGIETWSKFSQSIIEGNTFSYDFTVSNNTAYGNNLVLKNGKYCIYSGDVNQDGTIDASDLSAVDNDAHSGTTGYVNTDLNGDDYVDASDLSIVDNNAFEGISVIAP